MEREGAMIVRDVSAFLIGMILIMGMLGVASKYLTKKDDSALEEFSEEFIETQIEKALDLKPDALDGKIDLSPSSGEKNV